MELTAGDTAGAFADAVQAARLAPNDWTRQAQLARAAESVGAIKVGLRAAVRWARLAPDQWQAHAAVGRLSMALGRAKPARWAYHRAWQLNPNDPEVYADLAMLEAILQGRGRRAALERVEVLVANGRLNRDAWVVIVDGTVEIRSRWFCVAASYLSLGYAILVGIHVENDEIRAATAYRPAIASTVAAVALLWWFIPFWRRLTPAARRLLGGLLRREPLTALGVLGCAGPMVALLAVPFLWAAGLSVATLAVAIAAFVVPILSEVFTTGLGLGTGSTGRDYVRLVLQPPYVIGGVVVVFLVASVVRLVIRALRA